MTQKLPNHDARPPQVRPRHPSQEDAYVRHNLSVGASLRLVLNYEEASIGRE